MKPPLKTASLQPVLFNALVNSKSPLVNSNFFFKSSQIVASIPFNNLTLLANDSLKSISPFIAAVVIFSTSSSTPAYAAINSITS